MAGELQKTKVLGAKHLESFLKEALDVALYPALQEYVKSTKTPIDDILLANVGAGLKAAILKEIEKIYQG